VLTKMAPTVLGLQKSKTKETKENG
jgi:hypothetical protein